MLYSFPKSAKNNIFCKCMQYNELRVQLKDFLVFNLSDIRKIEPRFYRRRLNEWQAKGYIKKLRRGHYMFGDVPLNEEALYAVANRLYGPSYVSFEMALAHYGLIPAARRRALERRLRISLTAESSPVFCSATGWPIIGVRVIRSPKWKRRCWIICTLIRTLPLRRIFTNGASTARNF